MVRQARLDFPGALHHVMARGIERREIFTDDEDRQTFVALLGDTLGATGTACYAWALMPNHVHLLLTTGKRPLARVLQKVLGRYATAFNRRHRRSGHLFQNRYKSILCERDAYFQELVRYLHLNPVRARLVRTPAGLAASTWTGHAALLGRREVRWQDTASVLALFGRRVAVARAAYAAFVEAGFSQGRRPDLMGGGLIRSVGGWRALEALRRRGGQEHGDERILGSGDFVTEAVTAAEEAVAAQVAARRTGWTPARVLTRAAALASISVDELRSPTKRAPVCRARQWACWWLVEDLGLSTAAAATLLRISQPAASHWVGRARAAGLARLEPIRIKESTVRPG